VEALGAEGFSFYVFFDRKQGIFTSQLPRGYRPSMPTRSSSNELRNTRPIGRFAAKLGASPRRPDYGVNEGPEPVLIPYSKVNELPGC